MVWSLDSTHELELDVHQIIDANDTVLNPNNYWGIVPVIMNGSLELWFSDTRQWYKPTVSAIQDAVATVLTEVFPPTGDKAGGYNLTIYGSNIKASSVVRVGGTTATVVSNNGSAIVITVPAHSIGLADISVTDTSNITKTLSNIFTYTEVVLPLPVISAIVEATPATTSINITFTTDVNCSSYIEWGTTTTYDNSNYPGHSAVDQTAHSHDLTGLTPAVTYHYRITVMDINNNIVQSADGTFTTATPATFPVISAISSGTPTLTGATITWTTDIAANSLVEYGPTNAYGYSTLTDHTLVTSHSMAIGGLTEGTTYHYRVKSISEASAETVSADGTFTTESSTVELVTNTIWDNATTPVTPYDALFTVGTKFKATVAGSILGVKWYKYAFDDGKHVVVNLWDNAGTLLASKTSTGDIGTGWQTQLFDSPVSITAEQQYTVGYYKTPFTGTYRLAITNNALNTGITSDKLYAYAHSEVASGNGVANLAAAYPNSNGTPGESFFVNPIFQYSTGGGVPIGALTISNISASNITQTSATIAWTLSDFGTGYYEIGTVSGVYPITNNPGQNDLTYSSHIQSVTGLTPETTYYYRVRSTDGNGVETVSAVNTFATLAVVAGGGGSYHAPAPTSSLIVNVKNTGAIGNGVANDTAAIQAAINQVAGTGGTVYVPDGTYKVDISSGQTVLLLKSNMTFKMSAGAIIKLTSNSYGTYYMLDVSNASNVNIVGGTVDGNRSSNPNDAQRATTVNYGEWGMGIAVRNSSNVYIEAVKCQECWGDGIYVNTHLTNVNFYSVICNHNRRTGTALISVIGGTIRDSVFSNTVGEGHMEAGMDIEPNAVAGDAVRNMQIINNEFFNNYRNGMSMTGPARTVSNNTVTGNNVHDNGQMGLWLQRQYNNVISNNIFKNSKLDGIRVSESTATGNTITGNTISISPSVTGDHVGIRFDRGASIAANTVSNNIISGYPISIL